MKQTQLKQHEFCNEHEHDSWPTSGNGLALQEEPSSVELSDWILLLLRQVRVLHLLSLAVQAVIIRRCIA